MTNNDTIVVVSEDDFDNFFTDDCAYYRKMVGKCFLNKEIGIALKVLELPDNFDPYEFVYERFDECSLGWVPEDFNWLQEQIEDKYTKLKITPYANMNIAAEEMFHLGKNGYLYTTVSCGDEYYELHEITCNEFELIRNEAIKNDNELYNYYV